MPLFYSLHISAILVAFYFKRSSLIFVNLQIILLSINFFKILTISLQNIYLKFFKDSQMPKHTFFLFNIFSHTNAITASYFSFSKSFSSFFKNMFSVDQYSNCNDMRSKYSIIILIFISLVFE